MKVLVVGSGGREHALAWRLRECPSVQEILIAPGNPGCASAGQTSTLPPLEIATAQHVDLTIVGPEAPLVAGLTDALRDRGLLVFGPSQAAAQLEGSKVFAKKFMADHGIPTARYGVAVSTAEAQELLKAFTYPVVLKADGLAAGKGVVIATAPLQAQATITALFDGSLVGEAGRRVVVEEFLQGEEVSFIAISDGRRVVPLEPSQDHKAIFDGDRGPNTGGMGAYSDSRILTTAERQRILDTIIEPTIRGMAEAGTPFHGFLYAGLMMTDAGPIVLEYNVRLGDPEAQCLLHRLDCDLAAALYEAARGRVDERLIRFRPEPSVCVVAAAAGYPGTPRAGDRITGIDAAEKEGAAVFHAGTRLSASGLETSGGRVLGVTHSGRTLPEAIDSVYRAFRHIHFDGMQYRTDIGKKGLSRYNEQQRGRSSVG